MCWTWFPTSGGDRHLPPLFVPVADVILCGDPELRADMLGRQVTVYRGLAQGTRAAIAENLCGSG